MKHIDDHPPPNFKLVKADAYIEFRATYKKLQGVKVSDIVLSLYEDFRDLDATWFVGFCCV